MEVVTALRFNPAHQNAFVSASEDGLVAMFDFSGGINEDDAFRVRCGPDRGSACAPCTAMCLLGTCFAPERCSARQSTHLISAQA